MKFYTLEQVRAAKPNISEYDEKRIAQNVALAKEVSKFIPAEPMFYMSSEDGKLYYEHPAGAKIKHDSLDMLITFNDHSKKYSVICLDVNNMKNIDSYTRAEVIKKTPAPVNMGVLSEKKINDWIKYYEQVVAALSAKSSENSSKIEQFLESIKGMDVRWWDNKKQGEIIKNGIIFRFKIGEEHVSKEIEVYHSVPSTIEAFLKLSDNKFKG